MGAKYSIGQIKVLDTLIKEEVQALLKEHHMQEVKQEKPQAENPPDVAKMDIPLFTRLLEYAKEEAQTDLDLHNLVTNVVRLSRGGQTLNMEHYSTIIPIPQVEKPQKQAVRAPKQEK